MYVRRARDREHPTLLLAQGGQLRRQNEQLRPLLFSFFALGFTVVCVKSGVVIKITEGCVWNCFLKKEEEKPNEVFFGSCFLLRTEKRLPEEGRRLSAETVEGSALSLEGVHDVERGDGLSLGVLGVGDGVTDDVLEEDLEDTSGLFVDQTGDSLDTASSSQTTDGWLGDTLDVITKNLSVTLGAAFAETFTSFTTTRHVCF